MAKVYSQGEDKGLGARLGDLQTDRAHVQARHGVLRLLRQTFKTSIAGARHGVLRLVD